MTQIWTKQVHEDPSIPALFLAWAPQIWFPRSPADGFAVTFSDSRTAVYGTQGDLRDEESVVEWGSFEAKQMIEVWFVALAAIQSSGTPEADQTAVGAPFMFTGNDFGSLHTRRFDNTTELDDPDEHISPIILEHDDRARHHTAGVTAILPLPVPLVDDAPFLLTGSYDEGLRVYHATRRGEVLTEESLDGGVWRLQLLDTTRTSEPDATEIRFLVLASCMHAGTRVVRVTCKQQNKSSEWEIEVLAKFTEHESMNYASGVWNGVKAGEKTDPSSELLVVSSSFYDRRLCVWTANA
jgi:diphthamide biosynthesis protein 7